MPLQLLSIQSHQQIQQVADLAKPIWQQHFTPIIGEQQVAYMLEKFQSAKAIQQQIHDGTSYFAAQMNQNLVGYMALVPDPQQAKVMLSKLYVSKDYRTKGIGKSLLNQAECFTQQLGLSGLWLTVNRHNSQTIDWYQRQGFVIVDEQKKAIGDGFVMDDFIMQKPVG
ncbi:GNAT family N-acetyltransferase [Thiomicrospira sp.]|uniref:GNAT family N-acetyltransferase n=1 Tax=Thiomicrospira sp. TaxID=935 RepID=UPI002F91CF7A